MAVATEIDVINLALDILHEDELVTEQDDRRAARVAKRQYDVSRRSLLRAYTWNFARKRIILGPEATAPVFGFQSKFLLPSDCVKFVGFYDQSEPQNNYTSTTIPHRVEGRFLLADGDTAPIFYIADEDNPTLFDPCFLDMLVWDLARRTMLGLGGVDVPVSITEGFALARNAARVANAFEGTPEIIIASEWVDAAAGASRPTRVGPIT